MANQPKKYTKFVATAATATLVASAIVPVASAASLSDISGNTHEEAINALVDAGVINGYPDGTFKPNKELTRSDVVKLLGKYLEAEGYAPASTWKTSPAFADLKTTSNEELLKYASVVKEAGVFVGSHGNLLPGDLITRENMALTLVRMVNTLKDLSLEEFVAGQDFNGDVKDTNQAKAEARSAIAVLDFFDITNPAVSNFNPKGNTTRGQFATFLYKTANTDFGKAPSNEASEVVPEKLELVEKSVQSNDGEFVTLKVKVTTKAGESAANIPVTITIDPGNDQLLTPQIKEEVLTDAEGFATYTYTREYSKSFEDTVVAYSSVKSTVRTAGMVYWNQSLTIKDITEKSELADNEQKVYQIAGAKNGYYFVTFQENLNVTPDKAQNARVLGLGGYIGNGNYTTAFSGKAYEYTTGGSQVALIRLDANGKANLTVTGENATVTPIVYYAGSTTTQPTNATTYSASALQAKGTTAKFSAEAIFDLSIVAEGKQDAADYAGPTQTGGRQYVVTLKDKAGKPLVGQAVKIGFSTADGTSSLTTADNVFVIDADDVATQIIGNGSYATVTTNKEGKATFAVTGKLDAYVTPIAFIGNSLSENRVKKVGEMTYFRTVTSSDYTSEMNVTTVDNKPLATGKISEGQNAKFSYQLSDQNGFARSYDAATKVTYTVRAGAEPVTISAPAGVTIVGDTSPIAAYSFRTVEVELPAGQSEVGILVSSAKASQVTVTATPTQTGLSGLTSITKSIEFISGATTPTFEVSIASKAGTATTADLVSVTLTFAEAVNVDDIAVPAGQGSVGGNSSDNKEAFVYFSTPIVNGNTFTIFYKGKAYVFLYNNGKITLQS